jgi:hypothetical protein
MTEDNILFLSFYNLNYGIGASACLIDTINDVPQNMKSVVIEPNRPDLAKVKVELTGNAERVVIPIPLKGALSLLFPVLAFFYGIKAISKKKPAVIISMHHPFHFLTLTGYVLSKIFRIPNIVDMHDVWHYTRGGLSSSFKSILEQMVVTIAKNDVMVFVCSESKNVLESRTKIQFKNSLVLPNCAPESLIREIKPKQKSSSTQIRLIFVGRIGYGYGLNKIERLIEALQALGYNPSLFVVGHNQAGIPKYAKYMGNLSRKETLQLIADSDVGVGVLNPTITVPKKVVEYLALGKIVIIGKDSLSQDILAEYKDFIVEVSDDQDPSVAAKQLINALNKGNAQSSKIQNLYCTQRVRAMLSKTKTLV